MKRFTLLLLLVALAVAGWYWVSPTLAVNRLLGAVRAGDEAALENVIDFPAVRQNLKADLSGAADSRARGEEDQLGAFGRALGGMLVGGLVDMFVTPAGLAAVIHGNNPVADGDAERVNLENVDYAIERGISRFRVRFESSDRPDIQPALVFQRQGLRWRVVRIVVRESLFSPR
jgi:hypothetical protein